MYLDDWFILAAWALAVGFSASICAGTAVGLGLHEVDIANSDHGHLRKAEYAFSVLYNPALMVRAHSMYPCTRREADMLALRPPKPRF